MGRSAIDAAFPRLSLRSVACFRVLRVDGMLECDDGLRELLGREVRRN